MSPEKHIQFGERVKRLGPNKFGGYLVRFTGEDAPDLTGDYFDATTYFGKEAGEWRVPVLFHHGLNQKMGNTVLAEGSLRKDEWGIWMEGILDEREEYTKYVMDLIDKGALGLSSGAVGVPEWVPGAKASFIKSWVIGEGSLTHTPAEPKTLVVPLKSIKAAANFFSGDSTEAPVAEEPVTTDQTKSDSTTMEPNVTTTTGHITVAAPGLTIEDVNKAIDAKNDALLAALDARAEAREKAASKTVEPEFSAPAVITDGSTRKYDSVKTSDLAFTYEFLKSNPKADNPTDAMARELVKRMGSNDDKVADPAAKQDFHKSYRGPVKSDEIMYSTLSGYGDQWVGVAYSSSLWDEVRSATNVVSRIPSFEFPAGAESMVDPINNGDPTYYKVAQAANLSANPGGIPTNTVTASQAGTSNVTHTLAKFGARVLYTGELNEDAVIRVAPELQRLLSVSGAEHLESAVIDGDSATGGTTNINDIAGTPGGSEYWLNFDGFRKLALVTNTANARSAGTLTASDFTETAKLLGTAGQYAEIGKASFIVDANTYWTTLNLAEVKTRDVNSAATVENGQVTRMYGFDLMPSFHMHKAQPSRKANSAGKIDLDTAGNNTTGSILMVRWDRWKLGYRRRMTLETNRIAAADTTEIVVMMRASLKYRDTDAAAISYNVTL